MREGRVERSRGRGHYKYKLFYYLSEVVSQTEELFVSSVSEGGLGLKQGILWLDTCWWWFIILVIQLLILKFHQFLIVNFLQFYLFCLTLTSHFSIITFLNFHFVHIPIPICDCNFFLIIKRLVLFFCS